MSNRWTEEELIKLKSIYPIASHEELLEAFKGRTIPAIKTKSKKLKIRRPKMLQLKIIKRRETTQVCYMCKCEKPLDCFNKDKRGTRGVQKVCKNCRQLLRDTDENRTRKRENYHNNIENHRKRDRERYYRDKEKRTLVNSKCRKTRGRREEVNKRRAKIKNIPHLFTKKDWLNCLSFFNYQCCYCGSADNLQQEHFVPLAKNGSYTPNNILPACGKCNNSKNNQDYSDWYSSQLFRSDERHEKILKYLAGVNSER